MQELIDEFYEKAVRMYGIEISENVKKNIQNQIAPLVYGTIYRGADANFIHHVKAEDLPKEPDALRCIKGSSIKKCFFEGDFSLYDFSGLFMDNVTFSHDSILPNNRDLFQKAHITGNLPKIDMGDYDWTRVELYDMKFTPDSKLPKDKMFFQNNLYRRMAHSILPPFNMNEYDMNRVVFEHCQFSEGTIFLDNPQMFREHFYYRDMKGVYLPTFDYSKYSFKEMHIEGLTISKDAILPLDFIKQIDSKCTLEKMNWPIHFVENVFLHELPDKKINLKKSGLSEELVTLFHAKYKNSINKKLMLPRLPKKKNEP